MSDEENLPPKMPASSRSGKSTRAALSVAGGAIPFVGGLLSAAAGYWSESEQEKVNKFFQHFLDMLNDELAEKQETILEVVARIDMQDEKIQERVASKEFQSILKKTFRDWAASESETKRKLIRNILANTASTDKSSDDVVRMFLDWLRNYSEMHFEVIAEVYNRDGITRGGIWRGIGRKPVREDSADADLYKLLIRDLSTGGVIRQHREVDFQGNFIKKSTRGKVRGNSSRKAKSAFDDSEGYELTALGEQFVHYAMTDLPPKIEYSPNSPS